MFKALLVSVMIGSNGHPIEIHGVPSLRLASAKMLPGCSPLP